MHTFENNRVSAHSKIVKGCKDETISAQTCAQQFEDYEGAPSAAMRNCRFSRKTPLPIKQISLLNAAETLENHLTLRYQHDWTQSEFQVPAIYQPSLLLHRHKQQQKTEDMSYMMFHTKYKLRRKANRNSNVFELQAKFEKCKTTGTVWSQ